MINIGFFGTGEFSSNILKDLIDRDNINVKIVVSQPDKAVGRKKEIIFTPVKQVAIKNNIKVLQVEKLKGNIDFFNEFQNLDFIIVVAYGKILPKEILSIPKYGCINIHGSILAKYRGASPIQEAIKNGDKKTGITIMYMSEGMDEGDILGIKEVDIDINDKTPDIFTKFEIIGADFLMEVLNGVISSKIKGIKQDDGKASYCSKISKEDGEIDFINNTAKQIYDMFRAYTPWPSIYTFYNGKKLSIEECFYDEQEIFYDDDFKIGDVVEFDDNSKKYIGILCKRGILIVKQIKLEGKKSMDIMSFINGNKDFLDYNFNI